LSQFHENNSALEPAPKLLSERNRKRIIQQTFEIGKIIEFDDGDVAISIVQKRKINHEIVQFLGHAWLNLLPKSDAASRDFVLSLRDARPANSTWDKQRFISFTQIIKKIVYKK
jgi:hypothetical protein